MARPRAKDLTERELEIMHVFWNHPQLTTAEVRDQLATEGRELAYTTVATLVRILLDKGFLEQVNDERPFVYSAAKSHEEVSQRMVTDLVQRLFGGSRELLLVRLMEQKKLTDKEREMLEQLLKEQE